MARAAALAALCLPLGGCALVYAATEEAGTFVGAAAGTVLAGPVGGGIGGVLGHRAGVIAAEEATGMKQDLHAVSEPVIPDPVGALTGEQNLNTLIIVGLIALALLYGKDIISFVRAKEKEAKAREADVAQNLLIAKLREDLEWLEKQVEKKQDKP